MQERHLNHLRYFEEQGYTTQKYVIPYINSVREISQDTTILEIGCGEGGNLKPFLDSGCNVTGIDIAPGKIETGRLIYSNHPNAVKINLICEDIYKCGYLGKFDVVILRDVIEHLPNQEFFMGYLKNFLHEKSIVFFGFPPWQNPFGGHQQVCSGKFLSRCPYFHLLPEPLFRLWMKIFGESEETTSGLLELKKTGISIERFEKILKKHDYKIEDRTLYLFNPNYEIKFRLKPRKQNMMVSALPWFRNFFTTAAYYLVSNKNL